MTSNKRPATSLLNYFTKIPATVDFSSSTKQTQVSVTALNDPVNFDDVPVEPPPKKRKPQEYRDEHSWLTTDNYCVFCKEYYKERPLPKGSNGTFISQPFTNFKKATGCSSKNNKLLKHAESEVFMSPRFLLLTSLKATLPRPKFTAAER
jgi:hypothetical protein